MEVTPELMLRDICVKKQQTPSAEIKQRENADTKAKRISELLGIKTTWTREGDIVIDRRPERNQDVTKAIQKAKQAVEKAVATALNLEAKTIEDTTGEQVDFPSFQAYLDYAIKKGLVKINFSLDDGVIAGLKNGLINHWREVAEQIVNEKYNPITWNQFIKDKSARKTRWQVINYLESGHPGNGGWRLDGYKKGIDKAFLENKEYFPNQWLTHTTDQENVDDIAKAGFLDSEDINFGASKVVTRKGKYFFEGITFLFDAQELTDALPLIYGDYGLEGEIKTHFPVPIRLARAVVPTEVLKRHEMHSASSQGYIAQDIDGSRIK
jgi:hypothetical protein